MVNFQFGHFGMFHKDVSGFNHEGTSFHSSREDSSVGRAPTGITEVTGSIFFFRLLLSSCSNWKIYCDGHSSLSTLALCVAKMQTIGAYSALAETRKDLRESKYISKDGNLLLSGTVHVLNSDQEK